MGCTKSREIAIEELQDIANILRTENMQLEEEKEKLLYDQIDRPADDKEIARSLKGMTLELEEMYKGSKELLDEFVITISHQKENSPEVRMAQIFDTRKQLEELSKRIENFFLQKKAYIKLNNELQLAIDQNEKEIYEKTLQIQNYKLMCMQLKL